MSRNISRLALALTLIVLLFSVMVPTTVLADSGTYTDTTATPAAIKYHYATINDGKGIEISMAELGLNSDYSPAQYDTITLPAMINSLPVTRIVNLFNTKDNFKHLIIPASVTAIGDSTVYFCNGVESIDIQGDVTSIGNSAFRGCAALTTINIPSSVESIGELAFADDAKLVGPITLPPNLTELHNEVFDSCSALKGVTLPTNLVTLDNTFQGCTSLTSIAFPKSVQSIAFGAFTGCTSLTSYSVDSANTKYTSQGGLVYDKAETTVLMCPCGKQGKIVIPAHVTSATTVTAIGDTAFYLCTKLTGITLPNTITSIGYGSISGCIGLSTIALPSGLKTIGMSAFDGCSGLTSLTLPPLATTIGDAAFLGCSSLKTLTLPDGITTARSMLFANCDNLASVTLPASLGSIEDNAFTGDPLLTHVIFKGNMPVIAESAYPDQGFTAYYPISRKSNWSAYSKAKQAYTTLTLNLQNGSAATSQMVNVDIKNGFIPEPTSPTRTGYTFGGWYKDAACTSANKWVFSTNTVTTDTVILYAKWTANTYTVTFNSQYGTPVSSKTAAYNALITAPASPTRTGYAFAGWYKEAACKTAWNFSSDKVTGSITLYAKWIVTYTISATPNNTAWGAISGAGAYKTGTTAALKALPKAGYRFVRWLLGATPVSSSAVYTFTVSKTLTLKAEFAAIGIPTLTAASAGYNSVKLTWTAVTGANAYEVYVVNTAAGTQRLLTTTTAFTYTATGLPSGVSVSFKVRAKCIAGAVTTFGGYSSVKSAIPLPAKPVATVTRVTSTSAKVSWSSVAGATMYEVWRCAAGSSYQWVKTTSLLTFTNTGPSASTTYSYKVRAYLIVNSKPVYGSFSAIVTAKPLG